MVKRRPSSARWLREHREDHFVQRAKREGYRSRAAYKLLEMVAIPGGGGSLIRPGMVVVDLGAAPGGWSQVAAELAGKNGRVVAMDLLEMPPLEGVCFLRGDFLTSQALEQLREAIKPHSEVGLLLSDMAPNMSGIPASDQIRGEHLAECAFAFAEEMLRLGGSLIVKLFHGPGFHDTVRQARVRFERVKVVKPEASRARSSEQYLVATGHRREPKGV